jgi:hypothetical protein
MPKFWRFRFSPKATTEDNLGAEELYRLLIKNKWIMLVAFSILWILKVAIVSKGDPIAMVALVSNTASITSAGLSIIILAVGTVSPMIFAVVLAKKSALEKDRNSQFLLLVTLASLIWFIAPSGSIVVAIIAFIVITVINRRLRLANKDQDLQHASMPYLAYFCFIQAMPLILMGGIWLPSENITTTTSQFKGYLIRSEDQYSTFIVDHTRGVKTFNNDEIKDRELCSSELLYGVSAPINYLINRSHESYPKCVR